MERKQSSWVKTLFIVENAILAAVLLCYLLVKGIMWYEDEWVRHGNIHRYPTKLTYVAGVDKELDLTGGEVCFSTGLDQSKGIFCASDAARADGQKGRCKAILPMAEAKVSTNADLDVPGQYYVQVEYRDSTCFFPIVVIDPKDAVK
ncbi:MAG: hypothetical protein IJO10_04135 [Clostridia bacterium]|nr:hypothetical protein [Clostridia bacterium]